MFPGYRLCRLRPLVVSSLDWRSRRCVILSTARSKFESSACVGRLPRWDPRQLFFYIDIHMQKFRVVPPVVASRDARAHHSVTCDTRAPTSWFTLSSCSTMPAQLHRAVSSLILPTAQLTFRHAKFANTRTECACDCMYASAE
eukprot:4040078-Prymnesium_polylepis.1